MDIFVCIKQVPSTNKVQVDEETGVLRRDGVAGKMNPYDLFALETALRLKEAHGGRVVVGTMGPPQAEAVLREAFLMGADEGYLFSDRRLAGADVLATSYTIAQAIRAIGDFSLILCGKQTTDGDTAQVGAEMAEFLDIPHAANVLSIQTGADADYLLPMQTGADAGNGLTITAGQENRIITQFIPLPCLLCVDGGVNTPRLPSYKRKRELGEDPVRVLTLTDMYDTNENNYGLMGSPTQVERTYTPDDSISHETITGDSDYVAGRLASILSNMKYI